MARMSGRRFDRRIERAYRSRFGKSLDTSLVAAAESDAKERQREIAELAEAVAQERCPADVVEPSAIARAKGITLSFGDYGDAFDGLLEHRAGRFHIFGNLVRLERPDAPRARFTLGHELGHYYIDEHRHALESGRVAAHGSCSEYESSLLAEQEADHFAANLLMPRRRFLAEGRSLPPGLAGVRKLAERFGTSLTATALRYADLEVCPCAVVKWDWQGYAWKWLSTATLQAGFRRTFESMADLPDDGPTRQARAGGPLPAVGYFRAGTTTAAWFPGVQPGQWRDVLFIEQAVPLGRFGVLTILYPEGGRASLPGA